MPLIIWDMLRLGAETLASAWGIAAILVLAVVFWAIGRRFGLGLALRIGAVLALGTGFGFMAMAGQSARAASNTIYMIPAILAVLGGLVLASAALLFWRAR
ncbi:MAG: hypothetical protein AAF415_06080 [Pseudomonadota bacterium]